MLNLQVGVKVLLADGTGKFLFLRRSQEKYTDITELWDIAGGRIDPGESLTDNLQREVMEETGLEIVGDPLLVAAQDIMPREDLHVVRLTYVAQASNARIELSDEHIDYRWFTLAELDMLEGLDFNFVKILPKIKEITAGGVLKNSFTSNSKEVIEQVQAEKTDNSHKNSRNAQNDPTRLDEVFVKSGGDGDFSGISDGQGSGAVGEVSSKKRESGKDGAGEIGRLGENIATRYLSERGFDVITQNYRKKWGEIDIVAQKSGILHFVEVKAGSNISRGTDDYRPEEHVHAKKLARLHRTIQSYLAEEGKEDTNWQLDVLAVDIDQKTKTARCRFLENVI